MTRTKEVFGAFLFVLAGRAADAQDALLLPHPGEVLVGPISYVQTVQAVSLTARASVFLALQQDPDQFRVRARIVADLSDLQRKIGSLVDAIPLPTDNCAHFGPDNLVARIWGKEISVDGSEAVLTLHGDVDVWTCLKNPVPCTRVDWDERHVLGATIRLPRPVAYDCNPPIKNRNINQPFTATLPFRLTVVDPQTISVALGAPHVDLGGTLSGVTGGILRIAGVDISARAKEVLDRAINPDSLKASLPAELRVLNPAITRAEIFSNSGALAATCELSAGADGASIADLVVALKALSGTGG
jgi:hypothetical protein